MSKGTKKTYATARPRRVDWEAVERDFRAGRFSQVELATKHDIDPATLSRRIKRDREADPARWQQDLSGVVRQATNAGLMAELVKSEIKTGQAAVNATLQAAAEVNKQVILGHRRDIKAARDLAMMLLDEVNRATIDPAMLQRLVSALDEGMNEREATTAQQALRDLLKLHNRVASVQRLADTLAKLQTLERKAFGLDNDGGDQQSEQKSAAEILREFFGQLHSSGAGRIQVLPSAARPNDFAANKMRVAP